MNFKRIAKYTSFGLLALVLLAVVVVKKFGYSTPIPASNEKEEAFYKKNAEEWEREQNRIKSIK